MIRSLIDDLARGRDALTPTLRQAQTLRALVWPHKEQADIHPPSRDRFLALQNSHAGQRCYILGSAPSLAETPVERIGGRYVFCLNRAFEARARLAEPAGAQVISNPHGWREYGDRALACDTREVFLSAELPTLTPDPRIAFFSQWHRPRIYDGFFQVSPLKKLYHGTSVAFTAIALARWMGFTEIVLAGIDLDFSAPEPHFYPSTEAELQRTRHTSRNSAARMVASLRYICRYLAEEGQARLVTVSPRATLPFLARSDIATLEGQAVAG